MAKSKKHPQPLLAFEDVRKIALTLPEVEEGTSYRTPAFKVRGKLFARLHQSEDALVVRIENGERARRMKADPESVLPNRPLRRPPVDSCAVLLPSRR